MYEEPKEEIIDVRKEQNNNAFDNFAFYDNVAFIANRAIFTIEPVNTQPKPIVDQPKKKLRWFEAEENPDDIIECRNVPQKKKMSIVHEESDSSSIDTVDMGEEQKIIKDEKLPIIKPPEEKPTVQLRKKSLQQRRLSKALSLQIDPERKELPLIRQSSVPKFYIATPELNQIDSCVARTPSITLNTPILPQIHKFNYDLSSVVQIHKELQSSFNRPNKPEVRRAMSLKEKIKRQSSLISLNLASNHM